MVRVLHSPPLRVIGHPLVAWVLFTLTLYGLYFSPLFDLTLRNDAAGQGRSATVGFVFEGRDR